MDDTTKQRVEKLASSLGSERHVLERIRIELERRGWSAAELARRTEAAARETSGGAISRSVLSRLLNPKATDRRHISIDQLVALANVFDCSVSELLLPPSAMEIAQTLKALTEGPQLQSNAYSAQRALESAQGRIVDAMRADPGVWLARVADAIEEAYRDAGDPSDSLRVMFLRGVIDKYHQAREEQA